MKIITSLIFLVLMLALLSVPKTHAQQPGTTIHVVQQGENLYRIGLRYGCSIGEMTRANNIVNPNLIFIGQRLVVPLCGGQTTASVVTTTASTQTTSSATTTTLAKENLCYPGGAWGDGRCVNDWFWTCGYYLARFSDGRLPRSGVPTMCGSALAPIVLPNTNITKADVFCTGGGGSNDIAWATTFDASSVDIYVGGVLFGTFTTPGGVSCGGGACTNATIGVTSAGGTLIFGETTCP